MHLRREQVESQGRISELSATVKDLEDVELIIPAYWIVVGKVELLCEPKESKRFMTLKLNLHSQDPTLLDMRLKELSLKLKLHQRIRILLMTFDIFS